MIVLVLVFSIIYSIESVEVKDRYFEGQIVYGLNYKPYQDYADINPDKIKESFGSTVVLTYKNGCNKKEYYSPDGKLLSQRYLDLKKQKAYLRTMDSDTVFWFNINVNDSKTIFTVLEDTIIRDYPCKTIKSVTTTPIKESKGEVVTTTSIHYYASDLMVNPNWFKDYNEGNFNEIIKVAKGISIESYFRGLYWEQHESAKSIQWKKVRNKDLKFELREDEVLKEI